MENKIETEMRQLSARIDQLEHCNGELRRHLDVTASCLQLLLSFVEHKHLVEAIPSRALLLEIELLLTSLNRDGLLQQQQPQSRQDDNIATSSSIRTDLRDELLEIHNSVLERRTTLSPPMSDLESEVNIDDVDMALDQSKPSAASIDYNNNNMTSSSSSSLSTTAVVVAHQVRRGRGRPPRFPRPYQQPPSSQQQQLRIFHVVRIVDDLFNTTTTTTNNNNHDEFEFSYTHVSTAKSSYWRCGVCPFKAAALPLLFGHLTRHCPRPGYLKCAHCDYYAAKPQYIRNHSILHNQSTKTPTDDSQLQSQTIRFDDVTTIRMSEFLKATKTPTSRFSEDDVL